MAWRRDGNVTDLCFQPYLGLSIDCATVPTTLTRMVTHRAQMSVHHPLSQFQTGVPPPPRIAILLASTLPSPRAGGGGGGDTFAANLDILITARVGVFGCPQMGPTLVQNNPFQK